MMEYRTIAAPVSASFVEKKSEFIAQLFPARTQEEAVEAIEEVRKQHRRARHNVYAYLLRDGNASRYSDDGEPQGTAGMPILDVLQKNGLTDVCCVVTRYFGGADQDHDAVLSGFDSDRLCTVRKDCISPSPGRYFTAGYDI